MKSTICLPILLMILALQACTGQKPAGLKNTYSSSQPIKGTCAEVKMDGRILSKANVLNILDCSGWSKQFPALNAAIKDLDEAGMDHVLGLFNEEMFSSVEQRKRLFKHTHRAQESGQMDSLARFIQKAVAERQVVPLLDKVLDSPSLSPAGKRAVMTAFSSDNATNLKNLKALQSFARAYEPQIMNFRELVAKDDKFRDRIIIFLDDLTLGLDKRGWEYMARAMWDKTPTDRPEGSALKEWASHKLNHGVKGLQDIIKTPGFDQDIAFLNASIDVPIKCANSAHQKDFKIIVRQEMKHQIESLKNDDQKKFESLMLDGLTKYLAFQEFCGEKARPQGVTAFFNILNHVFKLIPSDHDFQFLKTMHQIFGEDRFAFLRLLSSDTFRELRGLLIALSTDEQDEQFSMTLDAVLAAIPDEDLAGLSEMMMELTRDGSQTRDWHMAWAKVWSGFSRADKERLVDVLALLNDEGMQPSALLGLTIDLFETFPDLSPKLAAKLSEEGYQKDLRAALRVLSRPEVQQNLSQFLSERGLFEFIKFMTLGPQGPVRTPIQRQLNAFSSPGYVLKRLPEVEKRMTTSCFQHLSDAYRRGENFYPIVNNLPEVCLAALGETGFTGQIYLWMNGAHRHFREKYGVDDFHAGTGVFAPGMLHFYFTKAVSINRVLESSDGRKGILANVDLLHSTLTTPTTLEGFHLFTGVYQAAAKVIPFEPRLHAFLAKTPDSVHNATTSNVLSLMETAKPRLEVSTTHRGCHEVSGGRAFGADPCLPKAQIKSKVVDMIRIMRRKNEAGKSLIQELVTWVHPKGGIPLENEYGQKIKYVASVDEIIRFTWDLSSKKTVKTVKYDDGKTVKNAEGTTIDRLEVVIRDIAFTNNFYGSFFKNIIADAKNYRRSVKGQKFKMEGMNVTRHVLKGVYGLPEDSKWRIHNVRNTFNSLVEVSDDYPQLDGSTQSYGNLIHSMMTAIVRSSPQKTQNFNPYLKPNGRKTEGHNGIFLTRLVEMSGLRHVALMLRSRVKDLAFLDTPDFKRVNANLLSRVDLGTLTASLQRLLDKYLDADRNQLNQLIADAIDYLDTVSPEEQKLLEEILYKGLILASHEDIKIDGSPSKGPSPLETFVKNWPEIRGILKEVRNTKEVLALLSELIDSALANPKGVNQILDFASGAGLAGAAELESLLQDPGFKVKLLAFLNHMASNLDGKEPSKLNWIPTMKAVLASPGSEWQPLINWLATSLGRRPKDKLTVSLLLSFLGEKDQGVVRLKTVLDEMLLNHRPELEVFLRETLPALDL